jgi:outer membrane protein assembly factor BamA
MIAQETDDDTTAYSSYIFLPAIYYTPETKWAYGIVFSYYFYNEGKDSLSRPSSFTPVFIYTQKKQIISELGFDVYYQKQVYHLFGGVGYQKFPNSFFGIGNNSSKHEETYTPKKLYTEISFLKNIYPGIDAGIRYTFKDSRLSKFEKDGLLATSDIPGQDGGTVSGAGIVVDYDTRDNIYYPSKGHYYQLSALFFGSLLGSDYAYNSLNMDFRQYISLYSDHILALQSYANFIDGNAPFYNYSEFGGSNIMRGYFEGRFRDKHTVVLQSEYRKYIAYGIGLVAFGGLGQVMPDLNSFQLSAFKYAVGAGLRFMIDDAEKLNIRFDYGITKDSSGFYINFTEAF